jgi:single-stranded-DNA-specific exonuclease
VLDHHLADDISQYAVIINNQLSTYPNKELSGVGIVWQFCRYIDIVLETNYANDFLDLVALGNCGDMMSLRSFETRYLITKGFKKENIKNPFIDYMLDKNSFPLSKADYVSSNSDMACTSMGAAFFIVPFVNAVTRSGTIE